MTFQNHFIHKLCEIRSRSPVGIDNGLALPGSFASYLGAFVGAVSMKEVPADSPSSEGVRFLMGEVERLR